MGRTNGTDDPWILVTNGDVNKAVKHYSYRFGAIEFHFKNTKFNGFNLEKTKIKKLSAFTGISLIVNIATLFLTILGADYCKTKGHYSKKLKIRDTKKTKSNNIIRIISLFNLGLTIFKKTYNSFINFKIKCNFILYDALLNIYICLLSNIKRCYIFIMRKNIKFFIILKSRIF